ncbi:MAG: tetratricopeptide repeat protein [Planctomycetales bacterium]
MSFDLDSLPARIASLVERAEHLAVVGRLEEAGEAYSDLLRIARSNGDALLRSVACANLAALRREAGRFEDAASWQQASLAAATDRIDESGRSASLETALDPADLSGLANDAVRRGEFDLAERLFSLSLADETRRGNVGGEADDWGSLGVVALLAGRPGPALSRLWRAYRLHRRLGDEAGAGRDLLNLGELCRQAGRTRIAFRCLRTAVRLFDGRGAAHLVKRARVLLDDAIRIAEVPRRDPLAN